MKKLILTAVSLLLTTNLFAQTSIIHNGDLEGDDVSSFKAKEYGVNEANGIDVGTILNATVVDGAGVEGSRGIIVQAAPQVSEAWDSQFWIVFDEPLYEQTELTVKFDYKASSEAAISVQAHCEPGEYNFWNIDCDVTFTNEWQTFEKTIIVEPSWTKANGDGDVRGFKSIAFNLTRGEAMTYYFDNIEIQAKIFDLAEPKWINVLLNGNCEGEVETGHIGWTYNWDGSSISEMDLYSFWCKDERNGYGVNIVDDAGFDGSRGIVVQSIDYASEAWDTQFFISSPHQFMPGQRFKLKFDYRSDKNATVTTQQHGLPYGYIYWEGIGELYFTTEWQTFEKQFTVEKNWCTTTDQDGNIVCDWNTGLFFQTIAFNLNEDKTLATQFYFDNIEWYLDDGESGYVTDEEREIAEIVKDQIQYNGYPTEPEEEPDPDFYNKQYIIIDNQSTTCDESNFLVFEWRSPDTRYESTAKVVGDAIKVFARSSTQARMAGNAAEDEYGNFAEWDSQFFITFGEENALQAGDKIQLIMDVKADKETTINTQSQSYQGGYLHYYAIGDVNFTTDWVTFTSQEVEVTDNQSEGHAQAGMYTIAFNLAKGAKNNFYFKNIKVIIKHPFVAEDEWNLMKSIYLSMENTDGWKQKWDFSDDTYSANSLPGVKVNEGHVTSVNLSNNNLTGNFPFALLTLPNLESVDVSVNNLTGDIGLQASAYMSDYPSATFATKVINISSNQFTGNLATFANCFANLESLDASSNCLEEVYPMISTKVNMLDISQQSISRTIPLHLANLSTDFIIKEMPSIILYDHINQIYSADVNLRLSTSDDSWSTVMANQNEQISISAASAQKTYYGQSGDILNVLVLNNNYNYGTRAGSSFKIALSFDEGDGNFDGKVNVLDLQTTLNYMFEEYTEKPYNFTASNLWNDDIINVQDAVCMVNLLLGEETSSSRKHSNNSVRRMNRQPISAEASVAIENGKMVINTAIPISSFDIVVSSDQEFMVASSLIEQGFNCISKQNGNQTHLIGYSLSGAQLPTGKNVIGETSKGQITYAMLADENACEIPCEVNGIATGVQPLKSDTPSAEVYRLSLGTKHAISIDSTGKKTMIKDEK